MKRLFIIMCLAPIMAYALPVRKGEHFRVQIPGEYIVSASKHKINHPIKRKLGKDLFLIKASEISTLGIYQAVYPNYRYYGDYLDIADNTPNDIEFNKQFHHKMIQTTKAWEVSKGDHEIIVAVTDNEFQINHKDMVNAWWKNPNEIPNNKIDDDGNGYVDDVYGWDFINGDNNVDAKDETSHGTHVSGTIAAVSNNSIGGSGIAPNVKVMPLRWYDYDDPWTSAIILETYHYAVDNGAKIISTSYNIDSMVNDKAYRAAVKYVRDNDVLIFNSAGNSGAENPRRQQIEDIILVCSVTSESKLKSDKKSTFSNYGSGIDICAPGDPIYATVQNPFGGEQDRYGNIRGTSMSTPVAAAVAALIWSSHPNFTDEEVRQKLFNSADDIYKKNSKYKGKLGAGRVNAFKAVQ